MEGGCFAPGLEDRPSWRLLQEEEIDKLCDTSQYLKIVTTGSYSLINTQKTKQPKKLRENKKYARKER